MDSAGHVRMSVACVCQMTIILFLEENWFCLKVLPFYIFCDPSMHLWFT